MNDKTLSWDDLKYFLAVARAGGLSGAEASTGKSAPTLGRRMLALEAATGVELFHRLPRGYELTDSGTRVFNQAVTLEEQILPLDRSTDPESTVLVKVSAGTFMTLLLCQNIDTLMRGNTSTRLRFISAEHELDIARRETIIGIRNQRPAQNGLACRKIGRVYFSGYAVEKSVKGWIKVIGDTPSTRWLASQPDPEIVMEVTAPRSALDLAGKGMGRALLPTFVGDTQPGLVRVTSPINELTHDQWLVTHQDERFRPEIRSTIDRIYEFAQSLHQKP